MAQKYSSNNLQKYAIGKQIDISIADGAAASSATDFYSVREFSPQNAPEPVMIEDAEGNRSTNSYAVVGDRNYPFSFKGSCEINKIGRFIYYATGEVVTIQDGATGAYQHTFTLKNNVVLPRFTIFFDLGAEGYRRLKNCTISKLTVTVSDSEASFEVEGMGTSEDNEPNSASSVSSLGLASVLYQSATGLTRYTFAAPATLTSVKNGDLLVIPTAMTGLTNASNKGRFIIVTVNDASDYVDVINNARTSATDDESTLTTSTDGSIKIVTTPTYPTPVSILLRRHSAVKDATNTGGLSAATENGLRNFTIEIDNTTTQVMERPKSADPLELISHNIVVNANFTQIMSAASAEKAIAYRDGQAIQRAWQFDLEDTATLLGTSVLYSPLVRCIIPQAMGIATRQGMGSNDELTYDWNLSVSKEQSVSIVLRNTIASYG